MGKRKYILVVDVEGTAHGFVYDVGFAVADLQGRIYETFSGVVADVIIGMREEMNTAYYVDKLPQYVNRIAEDRTVCKDLNTIRGKVFEVMGRYQIDTVAAYNVIYDRGALNRTIAMVTDGFVTSFFPENTIFWDIWGMACESILQRKAYKNSAIENGWVTEKGNIKTGAEFAYRYISDNKVFEEEHMGLDDVIIETAIMAATIATKKKLTRTEIPQPWRLVNPKEF